MVEVSLRKSFNNTYSVTLFPGAEVEVMRWAAICLKSHKILVATSGPGLSLQSSGESHGNVIESCLLELLLLSTVCLLRRPT